MKYYFPMAAWGRITTSVFHAASLKWGSKNRNLKIGRTCLFSDYMQIVLQQTLFPLPFPLRVDYHRCQKALDAKGVDTTPCDWYKRVYKSICPMSWVNPSHLFEFGKPLHVFIRNLYHVKKNPLSLPQLKMAQRVSGQIWSQEPACKSWSVTCITLKITSLPKLCPSRFRNGMNRERRGTSQEKSEAAIPKLLVCTELIFTASHLRCGSPADLIIRVLSLVDPVPELSFLINVLKCKGDSAIKYLWIYFTIWAEPYCLHSLYLSTVLTERLCIGHLMEVGRRRKILF